jgi:hypothetical protein
LIRTLNLAVTQCCIDQVIRSMGLIRSYEEIESPIMFTIQQYGISESTAQIMANVAMKTVTDIMLEMYDLMLDHCATIDPASQVKKEIGALRNELINKLIK